MPRAKQARRPSAREAERAEKEQLEAAARAVGTKGEAAHAEALRELGLLPTTLAGRRAWVRAERLLCAGPFKADFDPQETREKVAALLRDGQFEDARVLSAVARVGCGYNHAEVIAEEPRFEGQVVTFDCPRCGIPVSHRAPRFDDEAAPPPKAKKATRAKTARRRAR